MLYHEIRRSHLCHSHRIKHSDVVTVAAATGRSPGRGWVYFLFYVFLSFIVSLVIILGYVFLFYMLLCVYFFPIVFHGCVWAFLALSFSPHFSAWLVPLLLILTERENISFRHAFLMTQHRHTPKGPP